MENGTTARSLFGRVTHVYDDYGNQIKEWLYDENGEVISDSNGLACIAKTYNVMGDCVREVFYDSNRQATSGPAGPAGYAVRETLYDAAGRVIQKNNFDTNGIPMTQESGCPASESMRWNDAGYLTERIMYDETGEYFSKEGIAARVVNEYDPGGVNTVRRYYDAQDQLINTSVNVACITGVVEGSPSDQAGVQEYDVILQFDDWAFFSYDSFDTVNFDELIYSMVDSGDRDRNVCVCKTSDFDNGVFVFQEYTFAVGLTGLTIQDAWLDLEVVEQMREQYLRWREE